MVPDSILWTESLVLVDHHVRRNAYTMAMALWYALTSFGPGRRCRCMAIDNIRPAEQKGENGVSL